MAKITHGDVGDVWTPQATFTVAGSPTDPTNITVKIRDAAGTITTIGPVSGATGGSGIVRVSQGVFNTLIPVTAAGYWAANFTGTGAAAASEDHQFIADPSPFSSDYGLSTRALVDVPETKDWLQTQNIETGEDLDLVRVINDISERFHDESGREFKPAATNPAVRLFPVPAAAGYDGTIPIGDLAAAPTLVRILGLDGTTAVQTITTTEYFLEPPNRQSWEPITRIRIKPLSTRLIRYGYWLEVTGTWGFPAIPGSLRQAVLDAVAAVMDRDVEHYRQDFSPQTSGEGANVIVLGSRPQILTLPPMALAVARSFQTPLVG